MTDPVGLSIGTTNLVAARVGAPPVSRRSILTLYAHRPPEVGLPSENPRLTEAGVVMRGFVERVGDPVPLTAPDGSSHPADRLLVDALGALVGTVGAAGSVVVAVPAHWEPAAVRALSAALGRDPRFSPSGAPPRLVSEALAALVGLQAEPGLTAGGLIVLLDLGGGGTTISLADAQGFRPIGESVRYEDFSGDHIDKLLLSAVLAAAADADPGATTAVGSLARVRDQCRQAKERLSTQSTTTIPVDLGGARTEMAFSRTELEDLIDVPLDELLAAVEGLLARHNRSVADVSAVAVVGGGANIPLVRQRLSERVRGPVVLPARPVQATAIGAALMAARGPAADATTIGIGAADPTAGSALAWSQDDRPPSEQMPQAAEDQGAENFVNPYAGSAQGDARPAVEYVLPTGPISTPEPKPNRLPRYAVGAAAAVAVIAVVGMVHSVVSTSSTTTTTPNATTTTTTTTAPPLPLPPPPEPVAPPPEPTYVAPPPEPETVTETITPTTTTTVPTTTVPTTTTTTTPPTTPTTTPPTTPTTTTPPTTPAPAMTTTYITVPFVPVPIPIPVPNLPQQ